MVVIGICFLIAIAKAALILSFASLAGLSDLNCALQRSQMPMAEGLRSTNRSFRFCTIAV
jgi:hypothetical protein